MRATSGAMGEVTSAVIATSLVLIAVFVPVSFFPGTTGILYRQFSLTIAFAIAISAFNALTLSPALSAMFLRGEEDRPQQLDFLHIAPVSRLFASIHSLHRQADQLAVVHLRQSDSCRAQAALRAAGALLRRPGRDGLDLPARAHRLHSAGRPGLPDGHRAGAAGLFAGLHHCAGRSRQATSSPRIPISPEHSPSWASASPAALPIPG